MMLQRRSMKVLNKDSESRLQHRHAVVVQDLYSQWIQCYPTKTETAQETMKSLQKNLAARSEARYQSCRIFTGICSCL